MFCQQILLSYQDSLQKTSLIWSRVRVLVDSDVYTSISKN